MSTALNLIDRLIRDWSDWELNENFYLRELAPAIVRSDGSVQLVPGELQVAQQLRELLSASEWERLPELIAQRKAGLLDAIESDEARAEMEREHRRLEEEKQRLQEEADLENRRREDERRRAIRDARRKQIEDRFREKQVLVDKLTAAFEHDFLGADDFFHFHFNEHHHILPTEAYLKLKAGFVRDWSLNILGSEGVDTEQATAIAHTGGDVQVVARAGSGKTRTLVARALFLQKHCGIAAHELLLLAFNRAAASEIRARLKNVLGDEIPHVMTFHALAYALVKPEEGLIVDDQSAGSQQLSAEIQTVIDEHLKSDQYRPVIRQIMLLHFREDWERIMDGGFHLPLEDLLEYRRSLRRETLKGEWVKSFGEKLIANTLFEHDIDYKYERNFHSRGINYRPDFTIFAPERADVVIEYFGMRGDPDYDAMSEQKRAFWDSQPEVFLEFSPEDIVSRGPEGFRDYLLTQLEKAGINALRLSDEEVWQRIQRRAIDNFTVAMKSFVSRCRKKNLTSQQLESLASEHTPASIGEGLFLELGLSVHKAYLRRLEDNGQEDFDGLLWRAVSHMADGHSRFSRNGGKERGDIRKLRFVLIDEFQDFSAGFHELSERVRTLAPAAVFFCVGDDWQAINGFAGSDLTYFENFATYFRSPTTLYVSTNYRSPFQIVQLGNALMVDRGVPSKPHLSDPGWVRLARLSLFNPSAPERMRHEGDTATPAILRIVKHLLDSGLEVVLLSRRNHLPWYVKYPPGHASADALERFAEHIRSFLPHEDRKRLAASTTHKYKGREKDAVVVLDADQGCYPLIHPNWVFLRVFGDGVSRIEAEERRLFYVALTRSRKKLVILTDSPGRESPYITEIRERMPIEALVWDNLLPVPSLDTARVEVRVSNAYAIRDQLKALSYRWNDSHRYWCRAFMEEDFDFDALCNQSWAEEQVCIEVYSEKGELLRQR